MLPAFPRHGVVLALFLLAGVASLGLRAGPPRYLAVPAVTPLIAGSGWHVTTSYPPAAWHLNYRQWVLRNTAGKQALLYVQATTKVQSMLHWSGTLGFQGEGYLVLHAGLQSLRLPDGSRTIVSVATLQRLGDRLLVAYAVVSPDGIACASTNNPLRTAWDALRGVAGPYYLARLSVPEGSSVTAAQAIITHLFPPALAALQQQVR
jgi:hypothetical protein